MDHPHCAKPGGHFDLALGRHPTLADRGREHNEHTVCQIFSTGLSSGDFGGRNSSVMLSGTVNFGVECHPA
jgi:hypothetical protein